MQGLTSSWTERKMTSVSRARLDNGPARLEQTASNVIGDRVKRLNGELVPEHGVKMAGDYSPEKQR
jgi:hypothetical protein